MAPFFGPEMVDNFDRLSKEGKLETEVGAMKTYMLDTDIQPPGRHSHDGILSYMKSLTEQLHFSIEELDETNFFLITRPIGKSTTKKNFFFLDADRDLGRFWMLHTSALVDYADGFNRELTHLPFFDSAWLPMQLLRTVGEGGWYRGLKTTFDDSITLSGNPRQPNDERTEEQHFSDLTMRLKGSRSKDILDIMDILGSISREERESSSDKVRELLNRLDAWQHCLPVSTIKILHRLDKQHSSDAFSIDEMSYMGRVQAVGRSFPSHQQFVESSLHTYRGVVTGIERNMQLTYDDKGFHGAPLVIKFSGELRSSIRDFIKNVFSSTEPFRLWGLITEEKKDSARVNAVDLHVGQGLFFNIETDRIIMFLPEGTCGNTVVRFFTLFQHHYDANAHLYSYGVDTYGETNGQIF